jgi:phosphoserine phosphatase
MKMASSNGWRATRRGFAAGLAALALATLGGCAATAGGTGPSADPLPSWHEGANKQAILKFVDEVSREGSPSFVRPAERIAVFDNDGTLWAEQPIYFQLLFMIDVLKSRSAQHPEWRDDPIFKALEAQGPRALSAVGDQAVLNFLVKTHSGIDADAYDRLVRDWIATARHPTLNRPFTELVYQPQLELLALLRSRGFKTFIVSGGSVEFMRPWSERVYGIPPEQVIGTQVAIRPDAASGAPVLMREAKLDFVNDGPLKPVGIYKHIGQRPILAFGNSDGDLPMLQYTMAGAGARMALIVHHDDAQREFAYDRSSSIGRLDKALDEAIAKRWNVVSVKRDWKQVFPAPK